MAHVDLEAGLSLSSWYLIDRGAHRVMDVYATRWAEGELAIGIGDLSPFGGALLGVLEQDGAVSGAEVRQVVIPPCSPNYPSEVTIQQIGGRAVRVSVAEGYMSADFPTVPRGSRVSALDRSNHREGVGRYAPRSGDIERSALPDAMVEIGNYMRTAFSLMLPLANRAHWAIESATDAPL